MSRPRSRLGIGPLFLIAVVLGWTPQPAASAPKGAPTTAQVQPFRPKPLHQIRFLAILCENDDGSGGATAPNAVDAGYVAQLVEVLNQVYESARIRFAYDPSTDFERRRSTLLNRDFIVPEGLDFSRPESVSPLDGVFTPEGGQSNWRWCRKCHGLFFAGSGRGVCATGGEHDPTDSADYSLLTGAFAEGQSSWRWCRKCQALFFGGNGLGTCPAGKNHDPAGSSEYSVMFETAGIGQGGWRWCRKCQGLFHEGGGLGSCPDGGQHDPSGSGQYDLMTQTENLARRHLAERQRVGRQNRGSMVVFFCDGNELRYDGGWKIIPRTFAFSGNDLEFVAMGTGRGDVREAAYILAHESGHYFHQNHTHGPEVQLRKDEEREFFGNWDRLSEAERDAAEALARDRLIERAGALIREYVAKGHSRERGADVFEGDGLTDTPPDPSFQIFNYVNGRADHGCCGAVGRVAIPAFPDYPPYVLRPDRSNAMSYFKGCTNFNLHFSPMQAAGMRRAIESGNRRHLLDFRVGPNRPSRQ